MRTSTQTTARMSGLLTAVFMTLWGCASGPAPADHHYRIEVRAPSKPATQRLRGTLQVDRLRADALAGERDILYRESGDRSEIHKHPYHRWSDPAEIFIQTELISFLDDAGAADVVMPANARVRSDYQISGHLHNFERALGASVRVVVELQLTLTDSDGKRLARARSVESPGGLCRIEWKSPAAGTYRIRVRDLQYGARGGPDFIYRLTLRRAKPDFALSFASDGVNMLQGGGAQLPVAVTRFGGFEGPIDLTFAGLPEGVTVEDTRVPAKANAHRERAGQHDGTDHSSGMSRLHSVNPSSVCP